MKQSKHKSPFKVALDKWLESIDLYRKQIADDESSFFRAVADHVYMSQNLHDRVRQACVRYIQRHPDKFQKTVDFLEIKHLDGYLQRLGRYELHGGTLEMEAASYVYKKDFLIYSKPLKEPFRATENGYSSCIVLCQFGSHFDVILSKYFINVAGMCQSILYEVLYERVFQMKQVQLAVDSMLRNKAIPKLELIREESKEDSNFNGLNAASLLAQGTLPFTFKVAKSLDPNMYRNVEFDCWISKWRAHACPSFCNEILQVGSKCLVNWDGNKHYFGYIQAMESDQQPVIVFVETLGQMCAMPFDRLKPLSPFPSESRPYSQWLKRNPTRKKSLGSFHATSHVILNRSKSLPGNQSSQSSLKKLPEVPAMPVKRASSVGESILDVKEKEIMLPALPTPSLPYVDPDPLPYSGCPAYTDIPYNLPFHPWLETMGLPPPYVNANGDTVIPIEEEEGYPVSLPFCYWSWHPPETPMFTTALAYENFNSIAYYNPAFDYEVEPMLWMEPAPTHNFSYSEIQTISQWVYDVGYEFVPFSGLSAPPVAELPMPHAEIPLYELPTDLPFTAVEVEPVQSANNLVTAYPNHVPDLPPRFQRHRHNIQRLRDTYMGCPLQHCN